jgi:hypothetical protein
MNYHPAHDFGYKRIDKQTWIIYQGRSDAGCPMIGTATRRGNWEHYTAQTVDGVTLSHPSGRAKHFPTLRDAAKELINAQA